MLINLSCVNSPAKESIPEKKIAAKVPVKPPSSYADSLVISVSAAVFYQPDSVQLEKFKTISSKAVFETTTHESFYQMRNAKMVLKKYWPQIEIHEAVRIRYLKFIKEDKAITIIDLDTKPDIYGLFLFNPKKEPVFADMMNIDTALGFYFK